MQNGIENHCAGGAGKRLPSGSHLIEHRAQRKKVGARVEHFTARLLGRHVRHRSHCQPRAGQIFFILRRQRLRVRVAGRFSLGMLFGQQLGEAEVEDFCMAALGHKKIGGLDVAVDDPFCMRRVQRVGNLDPNLQLLLNPQRLSGNAVLQRLPLQIFHGDERFSLILRYLINGADIRMVQRRRRASLALKAFQRHRVFRQSFGQKFQRDEPAQSSVFRLEHHAHSPASQGFDDAIMRNSLANHVVTIMRR